MFLFIVQTSLSGKGFIRGRSLFISWGGGAGQFWGGGHEKNSTPNGEGGQNFIYESIGGVTNMISISFSGIKMLWLLGGEAPQIPSPIIIFFIFHAPLFTTTPEKMKTWRDMHILRCPQSDSFVAVHTVICKYRHFIRCILFPTSVIRKVNLQHPHPTRNVIVPYQEIESYRYIMFKKLSYHIHLYCTLCLFL